MAFVKDLWTKPGPNGRRVKSARWGKGKRWLAVWHDPAGNERSQACASKDAAESKVAAMRVSVDAGTYIDPAAGKITFRQYAEQWRANQLHHRSNTAYQAESRLRLWAYPMIGDLPIASVRRPDIQRTVNHMAQNLAPSTTEVSYGYIATVFKSAVLDGIIGRTPCVKIRLPEVVRKKVIPLTVEQVEQICGRVPERYRAAVIVCAATGLRQGELFGLKLDHLEGSCDSVVLRVEEQAHGGAPKTAAGERRVPIGLVASRALWRHLATYREGIGGYVFSSPRRTRVGRATASDVWRAAVAGMGLKDRSGWHELRHHNASLLIAAGLSPVAVAERLGHKDATETLRTYGHLWPTDQERAVAAVDAALGSLLVFRPRSVGAGGVPPGSVSESTSKNIGEPRSSPPSLQVSA